jgi:hypothetical protein
MCECDAGCENEKQLLQKKDNCSPPGRERRGGGRGVIIILDRRFLKEYDFENQTNGS